MSDTNNTTIVWAGLKLKDGFIDEFRKAADVVIAETRKEKGCLKYDLFQDVSDPLVFYFFEEYIDANAFAAHREMPYMTTFRDKRAQCVDNFLGVRVFEQSYSR